MTHCLNTLSLLTIIIYDHSGTLVQQIWKNPIIFLILLVTILNRLIFDFKRKGFFLAESKERFFCFKSVIADNELYWVDLKPVHRRIGISNNGINSEQ